MLTTLPQITVNGILNQLISPLDRGFSYGDGVFETCKLLNKKIPLWKLHRERLISSCQKLHIPLAVETLELYIKELIEKITPVLLEEAILKIVVTRGVGGRGYRLPAENTSPTICVSVFPITLPPEDHYNKGISVKICKHRLSSNPELAGLKHLNRLEQIILRTEWNDEAITEGLAFDTDDNLIEATASNIFIIKNNQLLTPELTSSGVAGVMRRFIIDTVAPSINMPIKIKKLKLNDLHAADEVFLCNSVFGIWPVATIINQKTFIIAPGSKTAQLMKGVKTQIDLLINEREMVNS